MIKNVQNFSSYKLNHVKGNNSNSQVMVNTKLASDSVSFKSKMETGFVDNSILEMLEKLQNENPVIGFKGNGRWLLPNLRKTAGQKFNLYLPDGQQLSYHKGLSNDFVIFSLKKNDSKEKAVSHVRLPYNNQNNESAKLIKTKNSRVLMFRVNLSDDKNGLYKKGQIETLVSIGNGAYEESALLYSKECKAINAMLKDFLPSFF